MKIKHLKAAGAAISLLIASGPALATSTGPQTLGAFAEATDVFQFTCPAGRNMSDGSFRIQPLF